MRAPKDERLANAIKAQAKEVERQKMMINSLLARSSITDFVVLQALGSGALKNLDEEGKASLRDAITRARDYASNAADMSSALNQYIDTFEPHAK